MKRESRRQRIIDHLMEVGKASIDELAGLFAVSKMTIHRDLADLEKDGLLRKAWGGATIKSNTQFESDFRYRKQLASEEKREIARAAVDIIEPGQAVIIDDGSTTGELAPLIAEKRPLTVITNNMAVIQTLIDINGIDLIALGGQYNSKFHGFFGLVTEQSLRLLRADIAFISTSVIMGFTAFHQDQEVVKIKRAMMSAAHKRYLLVDHTKFNRTALNLLTELSEFDAVVTGKKLSDSTQQSTLQQGNITLITV